MHPIVVAHVKKLVDKKFHIEFHYKECIARFCNGSCPNVSYKVYVIYQVTSMKKKKVLKDQVY